MKSLKEEEFFTELKSANISKDVLSNATYRPSLLVNDVKNNKKIITSLHKELNECEGFDFSVAFITPDGLASILMQLDQLRNRGGKGRILTTNYLNFTHPGALTKIREFKNIELRVYTKGGFHPKGYIFNKGTYYSIIVGSANLTATALSMNQEWSIKFESHQDGKIVNEVRDEFERVWNEAEVVTDEWIENYSKDWKPTTSKMRGMAHESDDDSFREDVYEGSFDEKVEDIIDAEEELEIVPNEMQQEAMVALQEKRDMGKKKALLIAATGTGKTYLSIFDILQFKPKKVLYVCHRDMILKKSAQSFRKLIPGINTGFLNGKEKDYKADYLFASIFTLAKDEELSRFKKDEFDYIIIDEVHHLGAPTYEKIFNYFTPKFLLGLTATPERSDGIDIYKMFDNVIAYEIHLQDALEADLLCPFHYYGITDLTVNDEVIEDHADFKKLLASERIGHIEDAIKLYKSNETPVKGLIFCSDVKEAKGLSEALNDDGFVTTYLTGSNTEEERAFVVDRLESDDDPLQYIITVDIFNEGVDIPSVNQVVMLRPTQSAIIFIQQLGRGLRKALNKSFVSVIDFIGNYTNNFFIPIALFGDNTYNKDHIRKMLTTGSACIPGTSTVQINPVSKQEIFDAISNTKFATRKFLVSEYNKLKYKHASIPSMMDFVNNQCIDPFLFIDYSGSYYEFKKNAMNEDIPLLEDNARKSLQFVSLEFAHGIRFHELLILKLLINNKKLSYTDFGNALEKYGVTLNKRDFKGMLNTLSPNFYTEGREKKYGKLSYVEYDKDTDIISRAEYFDNLLKDPNYISELDDCLNYGMTRATLKDNEHYVDNNFVLYRKYSRKDVCKLINWKQNEESTIYGYKRLANEYENIVPIFVKYKKEDDINDSIKYADEFIDNTRFSWMTKNKKYSTKGLEHDIINQKENDMKIMLFVQKDKNDGTEFYYLGNMNVESYQDTTIPTEKGDLPIVNINFDMENPVPEDIYNYLEA